MARRHRNKPLAVVLAAALCLDAAAQQDPERELERVRSEIESLEAERARQIQRRGDGLSALRDIEMSIASTRGDLVEIGASLAEHEARQRELAGELDAARERLSDEQDELGEQARMSYMIGNQEFVKLLLSQESPADFGRLLVYYDYLNRARSERIAAVTGEISELNVLRDEADAVAAELDRLRELREAELGRLRDEQAMRLALLADLDRDIESAGGRIERMRAEERRLSDLVAELEELLAEFPVDVGTPFAELRGALRWPVDGRVAAEYGSLRDGGPLRWSGVVLEAEAGTPVRALYHGRVAATEWMPFYGLVILLEHSDGYMSLYGHNGALLRQIGDWVVPGEAIAEVGDTGGRAAPSLYFEIRRNGDPVDPRDWVGRSD